MKSRWYNLTSDGNISIIIGLLRDGQYELALEKLEDLNKGHLPKPAWLYHIFVYVFGELGFHNESFQILQHQLRVYGPNQPMAMWQFLLDVYSRDGYYTGLSYIWHRMVVPGLLNPPDGTALNVLNTASRYGDTELVTSVMKMFTDRGKRLEMHHYEALIHAYTLHHDVRKALNVLCVTGRAGLSPDSSSTRSIYRLLKGSAAAKDEALGVLQKLSAQYPVPIAAFNVVLEATLAHSGFQAGMDLYRGVRNVCTAGPDLNTYHVLLRECTKRKAMRFLLYEIEALGIRPDPATYDHAVRICTLEPDYERAFWYLKKMTRAGEASAAAAVEGGAPGSDPAADHQRRRRWWMSRTTALALIRRCVHAEDPRVVPLVEGCRERDMDVDEDVRRLVRKARLEKTTKEGLGQQQQPQQMPGQEKQPPQLGGLGDLGEPGEDRRVGLRRKRKNKKKTAESKRRQRERKQSEAAGEAGEAADAADGAYSSLSHGEPGTAAQIAPPSSERPVAGSMGG